jgi:transcriptional antiterminator RfaH
MLDAATFQAVVLPQQDAAPAYDRCSVPSGSRPVWCVAATYPQAERRAYAALHRVGFTAYLPLITVRWSNRTWHTQPLFPGYCFVNMRLDRPWSPVTYAPGVFSLVSFDGKPATCPDTAVEAVRSAVDAAEAFPAASHCWRPGTPCSLAAGPLAGLPAIVTHVTPETANIAIMLFGHLRNVSVPLDCLKARDDG